MTPWIWGGLAAALLIVVSVLNKRRETREFEAKKRYMEEQEAAYAKKYGL